jgi:hypothetical protein
MINNKIVKFVKELIFFLIKKIPMMVASFLLVFNVCKIKGILVDPKELIIWFILFQIILFFIIKLYKLMNVNYHRLFN